MYKKAFAVLSLLIIGIFATFFIFSVVSQASNLNYQSNDDIKKLHFAKDEASIIFKKNAVEATIVLRNPQKENIKGDIYIALLSPEDKIVSAAQTDIDIKRKYNNRYYFNLPTSVAKDDLMLYRLKYILSYKKDNKACPPNRRCIDRTEKIAAINSVSSLLNRLSVKILAQDQFISGAPASIRLVAFNPADENPVKNAEVNIILDAGGSDSNKVLYTGSTNSDGTINANFKIPENSEGSNNLLISVAPVGSKGEAQEIKQPIKILRDYKLLITTDKPIYQPNQTIKIRSLTLNTATRTPIANKESVIEVYDSKGNKVFKKKDTTNKFGISSAEFVLADEVNMGNYKLKVIVDKISSEKTVKVSRYVLPKYKVELKTDKQYYLPSEVIKGSVDTNYFFGKPVSDAKVTVKVDKFDIGFSTIQEANGFTDKNGHFDFEIKLPDSFVGQNIAGGNAFVKFDVTVKDTAEHTEKKTSSVMVSAQPMNIVVIPESGRLAKNIENNIYVMTTYPDGSPVSADVIVKLKDHQLDQFKTDDSGIGILKYKPNDKGNQLNVFATDSRGNKAESTITLDSKQTEDSVLLRTDKAIAKVGQTINIQAITTKSRGTIYLDFIKNGQTILTDSIEIKGGQAKKAIDVSNELVGTIGINAYIIDKNSEIIRDSKVLYINAAEDLVIDVKADKGVYKPGGEAVLNFKVTDSKNHPVLSALGVYIVDESVFALSELQPGLEKVFFTLEKEILKPRYEIHGLSPDNLIKKTLDEDVVAKNQQRAAQVLFAAAEEIKDYKVDIDTQTDEINKEVNAYSSLLHNARNNINKALNKYRNKTKDSLKVKDGIHALLSQGYLDKDDLIDPWGNEYMILPLYNQVTLYDYVMVSKGADGRSGTADDFMMTNYGSILTAVDLKDSSIIAQILEGKKFDQKKLDTLISNSWSFVGKRKGFGGRGFDMDMVMEQAVMPMAALGDVREMKVRKASKNELPTPSKKDSKPNKQSSIKIRDYFPETLYTNPALITDENGFATITIPMADSITTWRLTSMANSIDGMLGSTTKGIRVFQDFFIDIDFPVALTQNDKVSVPIAIYNYLPGKQTITLKVNKEDWFESLDDLTRTIELESNQVSVEYFTVKVKKLGKHTLTVFAEGSKMSDAIKKGVLVEPDGKEFRDAVNGKLDTNVTQMIDIPANAIDEASKILVKIYPGYLSQVVEGLDKIFRMPNGCFEQTSSTTYPNILVLDYMKRTKQITPEIQMKAESYINSGYQRLLTFEVPGGGFEWFGNDPANKVLTAYGLMEFYDMSAVHDVDEAIIRRTQNWLVSKQEKDGSWVPDDGGIAEGAINQYKGHTLRTTAYVGWALASSGFSGQELNRAVTYIKENLKDSNDVYTYAVVANLFVLIEPDSIFTDNIINKLLSLKKEEKDYIFWEQKQETPMYGGGKSANIEATALATMALINHGKHVSDTNKALNYLNSAKDTFGTWHSTQATILSMKALLMSMENATSKINAGVTVGINGKTIETFNVNPENSDVVKQIDLKQFTQSGSNKVSLEITGEGSMLYQIVKVYYIPWDQLPTGMKPELDIDVRYDKTTLDKDDTATAFITVINNTDKIANMVMVDLGIPPGFKVDTADLDKLVKTKVITKYSIAARQIILYFDKLQAKSDVKFDYKLKATLSIKAKSGQSKIYKYYEPEVNTTIDPIEINVK